MYVQLHGLDRGNIANAFCCRSYRWHCCCCYYHFKRSYSLLSFDSRPEVEFVEFAFKCVINSMVFFFLSKPKPVFLIQNLSKSIYIFDTRCVAFIKKNFKNIRFFIEVSVCLRCFGTRYQILH